MDVVVLMMNIVLIVLILNYVNTFVARLSSGPTCCSTDVVRKT